MVGEENKKTCQSYPAGRRDRADPEVYRWLLIIVMPIMRVIVMIAVVDVMIMSGLTLIVIAVGVVTVGVIAVGTAWSDGNGHLCLRLRRKESQKSQDGCYQEDSAERILPCSLPSIGPEFAISINYLTTCFVHHH
jgi:hypothetical protein